jgi:hypothetical protein
MINCSIESSEQIIHQIELDIPQKIFRNIQKKFSSIIIKDIRINQNQNYD